MARPCGCAGECGCSLLGYNGISVTGSGTQRDQYRIGLANPLTGAGCDAIMSCVTARLGRGLTYNSVTGRVEAMLSTSPGNSITYGSDGGLFSTGGSGGSGDPGVATVDGLVARTDKIIGGSYGAGISMQPEGPADTYRVAMNLRLPLVHVPVRRSREGFMWAEHYHNLGYYNDGEFFYEFTNALDASQGQTVRYYPGGKPVAVNTGDTSSGAWPIGEPQYEPNRGYFGSSQHIRYGLPRLSEVFETSQRRTVLYLEVKDLGSSYSYPDTRPGVPQTPTPAPLTETPTPLLTFVNLNKQITQYGNGKSVIVGVQLPTTINASDRQGILDGLTLVKNSGVATAVHFNSTAEMNANPPATLTSLGVTWAFFSYTLADSAPAQIKTYKDAGIQCMLHSAHRAHHYNMLSKAEFGADGIKGAICLDPIYVGGPQNNYEYRSLDATWGWGNPDYGRHSGYSNTGIFGQRDHLRGYVKNGIGGEICLDPDVVPPGEPTASTGTGVMSAYYILMGEQCPVPFTQYDLDFTVRWEGGPAINDPRYMGVVFGVPEDRHFKDWIRCDQYSKGYKFSVTMTGSFVFERFDGIPYPGGDPLVTPPNQYMSVWSSGFGNVTANTVYALKVRVRNDRIVCGPANQAENGANTRTFTATTPLDVDGVRLPDALRYRGPFFYLGRHFWNTGDARVVRWGNLKVTNVP